MTYNGLNFQQVTNTSLDNFLISPFTLQTLLTLSASGASEETAKEIYQTLSLPSDRNLLHHFFQIATTHNLKNGEFYTLNTTNKIVFSKNLTILEEFKKLAKEIFAVDVAEREDIEVEDEFVLNSELAFRGLWSKRFENRSTYKSPFYVSEDEMIEVETMHSTGDYSYYEDKELRAEFVEMPFKGNEVTITFVLPSETSTLEQVEGRLLDVLAEKRYKATYMKMALPKFTLQNELDFTEALKEVSSGCKQSLLSFTFMLFKI